METLGHSTIATTMDIYSHVMPSLLQESADAMDRALGTITVSRGFGSRPH